MIIYIFILLVTTITLEQSGSTYPIEKIEHHLLINDSQSDGIVYGTVLLPGISEKRRNFRGRAYRSQRGTLSPSDEDENRNLLTDTIISLHPVSFDAEVQPSDSAARINQINAEFVPHVTPVVVGSTVEFVNSDSFYHNVFSLTPGARFNIGRRPTGDVYEKKIPNNRYVVEGLGEIQLFCDIHSQMNAVIISLDTPYFTRVNEDGSFLLDELPAGTYELKGYNPRFELTTQTIEITEGQRKQIQLAFNS